MMLMTPAMASEPYWAEAPSRRTSMRSIIAAGIALKSVDTEPRPMEPLRLTSALVWRRLPLISTSTWSRSEEHTSELQSPDHLVCPLLLEKKKRTDTI